MAPAATATPTAPWLRPSASCDWRACPAQGFIQGLNETKERGAGPGGRRCANGSPAPGSRRPERAGGAAPGSAWAGSRRRHQRVRLVPGARPVQAGGARPGQASSLPPVDSSLGSGEEHPHRVYGSPQPVGWPRQVREARLVVSLTPAVPLPPPQVPAESPQLRGGSARAAG